MLFTLAFLSFPATFIGTESLPIIMKRKTDKVGQLSQAWREAREEAMARSQAKNNSKGTQDNIRRNSVYLGLECQRLGITSPSDMTQDDFLRWLDGLREGTLGTKKLGSTTIKKRVETLRAVLQACKLTEQLDFVDLWKPDREVKEIRYWTVEELEAMDERALAMFGDDELKPRAMAHLIHSMMAPRISDVAAFQWEYFDFQAKTIQFRAQKNQKRCSQFIQERYIPILRQYYDYITQFKDGDVYLFPSSILNASGTTKMVRDHATDKTIRMWLKQVRDSASLNGEPVQTLPSHSYRHSLAMRYLANGNTFENIAMVLGDEIGTLEKHYAELVPNDAQRLAFERAFKMSSWISSEGTVQPEWLKRPRGLDSNRTVWRSPPNRGFGLSEGSGRWGI